MTTEAVVFVGNENDVLPSETINKYINEYPYSKMCQLSNDVYIVILTKNEIDDITTQNIINIPINDIKYQEDGSTRVNVTNSNKFAFLWTEVDMDMDTKSYEMPNHIVNIINKNEQDKASLNNTMSIIEEEINRQNGQGKDTDDYPNPYNIRNKRSGDTLIRDGLFGHSMRYRIYYGGDVETKHERFCKRYCKQQGLDWEDDECHITARN